METNSNDGAAPALPYARPRKPSSPRFAVTLFLISIPCALVMAWLMLGVDKSKLNIAGPFAIISLVGLIVSVISSIAYGVRNEPAGLMLCLLALLLFGGAAFAGYVFPAFMAVGC